MYYAEPIPRRGQKKECRNKKRIAHDQAGERESARARIQRNHKKQIATNNNYEQVDAPLAVRIISALHSGVPR